MGDRAMAEIKTEGGSLFVYTHWGGYNLPERAKEAIIKAETRWDDLPYATRIIVDQLTKESRDDTSGCGLMLNDNAEDEYNGDKPSVIIDLKAALLTVIRGGQTIQQGFKEISHEKVS